MNWPYRYGGSRRTDSGDIHYDILIEKERAIYIYIETRLWMLVWG